MRETGATYLYGHRPVEEAIRRGIPLQKLYVLYGSGAERRWRTHAQRAGIPCTVLDRRRFAAYTRTLGIAPQETQGVLALTFPIPVVGLEQLGKGLSDSESGVLVALDGIEDPQNLGAIARSAEAAGAHGLLLPRRQGAPMTPAAIKAAAGALLSLPVAVVSNLATALRTLQQWGWWVLGTAPDGERLYWEELYDRPVVLVIGNEHRGMRPILRACCDLIVRIPLYGTVGSLNAAAAASVVLFEIQRQRCLKQLSTVPAPEADDVPG